MKTLLRVSFALGILSLGALSAQADDYNRSAADKGLNTPRHTQTRRSYRSYSYAPARAPVVTQAPAVAQPAPRVVTQAPAVAQPAPRAVTPAPVVTQAPVTSGNTIAVAPRRSYRTYSYQPGMSHSGTTRTTQAINRADAKGLNW